MPERYEYRVVEVRESMVGGKMSGGKLEKLLNEHASQGWQLKAITSADVKGRVGPGGPRACLSPSSVVSGRASPQRRSRWPSVHPQFGGHSILPL
jgi:Domain of unknown function (DUF4177)